MPPCYIEDMPYRTPALPPKTRQYTRWERVKCFFGRHADPISTGRDRPVMVFFGGHLSYAIGDGIKCRCCGSVGVITHKGETVYGGYYHFSVPDFMV